MSLALDDRRFAAKIAAPRLAALSLRHALRELRSGLSGFYVFMACIGLGVMAIAGVGAVATSLHQGLAKEGRNLLGGDIAFGLIQREASPAERQYLDGKGAVTASATLRAMVKAANGELTLVEAKAVDARYPLLGEVEFTPPQGVTQALARQGDAFGAAADPALMARLGLRPGDELTLGAARLKITAQIDAEPDRLGSGFGFGPRLLISDAALRASGLLQPGSLVRWTYRLRLPDGRSDDRAESAVIADARRQFPDAGWEIRSRTNASPQLERSIERFTQFLTLVGLAALLVGGVGVANAVKSHIDRRREAIATLKTLGATGRTVFSIYVAQVMLLALAGALIGLVLGAALPFVLAALLGHLLPLPIAPAVDIGQLGLALVYGLLTALAFALWPLGRVHAVNVASLFRDAIDDDETARPPLRTILLTAAVIAALIALVIVMSFDRLVAATFVSAAILVFLLLRVVAAAVMALARRTPRPRATMLRLAIANIYRPGALTPTVVLSLGLGLSVLVTVSQIDGNLRRQFLAALPEKAPSFFFLDIPANEADAFTRFVEAQVPQGHLERVPMLRGRITAARGVKAEDLKTSSGSEWALQGDRGLTYATEVPKGSSVVEGKWWGPDYDGPPLVSMEKKVAEGLGLKIGDTVTVNVLGRNLTATISNLRSVDWQSLGINFVLVFTPKTFAGAPHTHLATLTLADASAEREAAIVRAVAQKFPMVTSIPVREALRTVGSMVENLALGVRGASAITLLAAILVLGGALAAGHRHRVYDAVILKTLGATRARLIGAYALEYLLIGLATAIFGVAAGSVSAWLIVTRVMNLGFAWQAGSAIAVVAAALVVTVGLGLIGTLIALGQKPAPVLRNL